MTENYLLKDFFNRQLVRKLAQDLELVWEDFPTDQFTR